MISLSAKITISDGVTFWPGALDEAVQHALVARIFALARKAPFYRPTMPHNGKPFSVDETNFGSHGWVSDRSGYRYEPCHPQTGKHWPAIPKVLLDLWREASGHKALPQCCLVNLYRAGAKMGLHQDKDEDALNAPVVSVSLGDDAIFRIGGAIRKGPTKSVRLRSGDVLMFGGNARLAFHGIDRIISGTSRLVPDGGRINLTLRRVTR